jgi:hypothetical protein
MGSIELVSVWMDQLKDMELFWRGVCVYPLLSCFVLQFLPTARYLADAHKGSVYGYMSAAERSGFDSILVVEYFGLEVKTW